MTKEWTPPSKPFCPMCLIDCKPVGMVKNGRWDLFWACECGTQSWRPIEWPFGDKDYRREELEKRGFECYNPYEGRHT